MPRAPKAELTEKQQYDLLGTLYKQHKNNQKGLKTTEALEAIGLVKPDRSTKEAAERFLTKYHKSCPKPRKNESAELLFTDAEGEKRFDEPAVPGSAKRYKLTKAPRMANPVAAAKAWAILEKVAISFMPPGERANFKAIAQNHYAQWDWPNKIAVEPRYPPLFPNHNETYSGLERVAERALSETKGFAAHYRDASDIYYPVRLIRREQVTYLVCSTQSQPEALQEYALHRFILANTLDTTGDNYELVTPNGAVLTEFKPAHFKPRITGHWGKLKSLTLVVKGPAGKHLAEMRFHESERDRPLTKAKPVTLDTGEDAVEITSQQIDYTYEFKTWLLGLGGNLVSLKAEAADKKVNPLKDIQEELRLMVKQLL